MQVGAVDGGAMEGGGRSYFIPARIRATLTSSSVYPFDLAALTSAWSSSESGGEDESESVLPLASVSR